MIKKTLLFSLCLAVLLSVSAFAYNWNTVTVSSVNDPDCYSFIGSNADGNPLVIFQGLDSYLLSASLKDGEWDISRINERGFSWEDASASLTRRYASNPDKSQVYVKDGKLIYAYWNSRGWSTEYIDKVANAGAYPSMIVNDNGLPIVSYYDKSSGQLKCAFASEAKVTKTASAAITISAVSPVSIVFDTPTIIEGQSTKLTWSCSDPGATLTSSTFGATYKSGSINVSPFKTTTYKFTVKLSTGSTASASAVLKVTQLKPAVTITASAKKVVETRSVKLTWSSSVSVGSPAVIVPINPAKPTLAISSVNFPATALNGSVTVTPAKTTTYKITVRTTAGKTATKTVTVTVTKMVPVVTMQVSPKSVSLGNQIALAWECTDTDSMTSNFGKTALVGAELSTPLKSGTFSIAALKTYNLTTRTTKKSISYTVKAPFAFVDIYAPVITTPKANNALDFLNTKITIEVYAADPSGLSLVEANIIYPDEFVDTLTLTKVAGTNKYTGEYYAPINFEQIPVNYILTVSATDGSGNPVESAASGFIVPGSDDGPPPPPTN